MIRVKICGVTDAATMALCAELGVEWIGLNFHPASPRFVTPDQALALHESAPPPAEGGPRRVGLFVGADDAAIGETMRRVPLDVLQIYDTAGRAEEIRARTGRETWLAKGIAAAGDLPVAPAVDGFVIEAPREAGDTRPGGLGRRFDWALTAGWQAPGFWILAGGLTPGNVRDAIAVSGAGAVDVSSGVESAPGVKSAELIRKFVEAARAPLIGG